VHDLLPFIVIGITVGSVYGLAGVGLVLTYKTSGIFNFAHGSMAALSVFVFYFLRTQHGWPWPLAGLVSVLVLGPLMGLVLERMAALLSNASHVLKIAATVGIVISVVALGDLWYGNLTSSFPSFLPTTTFRVLGVNVGWDQLTEILIALGATGALYYFFRFIRLGAAMRGVVDDPSLVAMTGESPVMVRRWAWMIGSTFAALSGILLAPSLSLSGLILVELVVQAFGAAAIGYFSSLPLTYAGGLIVGVVGAVSTKYVAQVPSLSGLPPGLPFIILFLVLIFTPRVRLAARRYVPNIQLADPYYAPPRIRVIWGALIIGVLCVVPFLVGPKLAIYSAGLADVILFLSLGLLVRLSGQVSLCQYAFAAVGAASMAHYSHGLGIPWFPSLLLAGLTAVPIGAIIAIPAIRLSGVFLALATYGFGILLEQMFYTMNFMFGPTTAGIPVARPSLDLGPLHFASDRGFYYVILFFTIIAAVIMVAIMRSRLGRVLRAMSDSPLALETLGTTVNVSRVLIFCISSFMAAVSGALTVSLFSFAVGSEFSSFSSLTLMAIIAIIPIGAPWFAVMAAAGQEVIPAYINVAKITDYTGLFFGLGASLSPISLSKHPGMPKTIRRGLEAIDNALPRRARAVTPAPEVTRPVRGVGLEIAGLTVKYGGALAVSEFSMTAPTGAITGLIGPNGAGKTTTFNAACGLLRPTEGRILLHGQDVSSLGPAARARRGLGRTFQRVELFNSLTVRENISLGREAILGGGSPWSQLVSRPGDKALIAAATDEAIARTGIGSILDLRVGQITTGQRRLVELARVLAGPFDMILLDEPSSGLDQAETEHFGTVLTEVTREWGVGMLLVEHDMALVRQVCNRVWVLDFGRLIFEGDCSEMLSSDVVKAAYLGSEGAREAADVLERERVPTGGAQ
jgi:ABC-type branched-subunit amino acid transport system ATPase component/branched-subunit amino acid ABC-type transport system permease component